MKSWLKLFRRSNPVAVEATAGDLRLIDDLNSAIRLDDIEAGRIALQSGAPSASCTLDHEGYHTPRELAMRLGRSDFVELLDDGSRTVVQSAPERSKKVR